MGILADSVMLVKGVLTDFGVNEDASSTIVSGAIMIFVLSWVIIMVYILLREREVLEHWKYPNLVVIFVTAALGFLSFIVVGMGAIALMLILAFGTGQLTTIPFAIILVFTGQYMAISLLLFKKPFDKFCYTSIVPRGFLASISMTGKIIVILLSSITTLWSLHYSFNTGLNISGLTCACVREDWENFFISFLSALMTVLVILFFFCPKKLREYIKRNKHKLPKWMQKLSKKEG